MGEGVGQGVGVGRRVILVFLQCFSVFGGGKEGREGFSFLDFFPRAALWLGRFLCWCV